jgi:CO dehydrogenase maturation factor
MLVVVEPGQRAVDCARRIRGMAREIGIHDVRIVANKVATPADERFIREALPEFDVLGWLPFTESLRVADREGRSVVDGAGEQVVSRFREILARLEETARGRAVGETRSMRVEGRA